MKYQLLLFFVIVQINHLCVTSSATAETWPELLINSLLEHIEHEKYNVFGKTGKRSFKHFNKFVEAEKIEPSSFQAYHSQTDYLDPETHQLNTVHHTPPNPIESTRQMYDFKYYSIEDLNSKNIHKKFAGSYEIIEYKKEKIDKLSQSQCKKLCHEYRKYQQNPYLYYHPLAKAALIFSITLEQKLRPIHKKSKLYQQHINILHKKPIPRQEGIWIINTNIIEQ